MAELDPGAARDLLFIRALLASGVQSRSVFLRATVSGPTAIQAVLHVDYLPEGKQGNSTEHPPKPESWPPDLDTNDPRATEIENAGTISHCTVPLQHNIGSGSSPIVLVCMDSLVFLQAVANMRSASEPVAKLSKVIAVAQVFLQCFLLFDFVDTNNNLADPSHAQI